VSQRNSGYERRKRDFYATPAWVTEALVPHIPERIEHVWEPACGDGAMAHPLTLAGFGVLATDIAEQGLMRFDFLGMEVPPCNTQAIITNPPYELATEFCERALMLTEANSGFVAILLRTDFDHAKSRTHLFRDCPAFAKKLVLMKRIVWFADENGKPKASPSYNHAWYVWDWKHEGPPTIAYGP